MQVCFYRRYTVQEYAARYPTVFFPRADGEQSLAIWFLFILLLPKAILFANNISRTRRWKIARRMEQRSADRNRAQRYVSQRSLAAIRARAFYLRRASSAITPAINSIAPAWRYSRHVSKSLMHANQSSSNVTSGQCPLIRENTTLGLNAEFVYVSFAIPLKYITKPSRV